MRVDIYAFDPKGEYRKYGIKNKAANLLTREEFLAGVPTKYPSNVNVIFEDATGFFGKGALPKTLVQHINSTFHSKNMNIFMYHGITSFSGENLIYMDYLILFRTKDKPTKVYEQFSDYDNIIEAYEKVMRSTNGTNFDRLNKVYLPGEYKNEKGETIKVSAEYSKNHYHDCITIKLN